MVTETGCHHRHANRVLEIRIDDRADHHGGVIRGEFLDRVADFLEFADRQVHAGRDIDEDSVRASEIDVLEQRARYRSFGRLACAVFAG